MTSPRTPAPDVSIVVPIYNEVDNLPDLVARIGRAMAGQPLSFELLAVDDGSTDGSRARLSELAATTPWLRPVLLARNYGQSSALQAGFDRVRGRYVVTLDADLQNEPDDIPLLLQRLETDPAVDMVSDGLAEISRTLYWTAHVGGALLVLAIGKAITSRRAATDSVPHG